MIPEPYRQEVERVDYAALKVESAAGFRLCAGGAGRLTIRPTLISPRPIISRFNTKRISTTRVTCPKPAAAASGLILTDVDRGTLHMNKNGTPVVWQFGPERRTLCLAQRADFFRSNQSGEVLATLDAIAAGNSIPLRSNRRSGTVETVLGLNDKPFITSTYSWKDLGYRKMSSTRHVSRTLSAECGLVQPHRQASAQCAGLRLHAGDFRLARCAGHSSGRPPRHFHAPQQHLRRLYRAAGGGHQRGERGAAADTGSREADYQRAARNIGAAIGCSNVADEVADARYLYERAGVRLFRIYTINSDPRVVEVAAAIRAEFGDDIELFVGQVSDKAQCLKLIAPEVRADGLFFGHGGGRQCTSATNGMAVTTLEEVYSITTDERFNHVTIAVEGGIGTSMGHLLLMGVDLISYNQQLARCVIEQGDIYFEHKSGKVCMPYHGSASAPTMIIESANPALARKRLRPGGRTRNVEGKAGYRFFEEKANSMVFYVNTFKHYAARALADVGVTDMAELREFVRDSDEELIRVVSSQASAVGQAYGNWM